MDNDKDYDEIAKEYIREGMRGSRFILEKGGKKVVIQFARVTEEDWERVKKLSTEELKEMIRSYEEAIKYSVSVYDVQMLDLMYLELERREK